MTAFLFGLLPVRTWIYIALSIVLVTGGAWLISSVKSTARAEGRAEIQAKWDQQTIQRQDAAASAALASMNETGRRLKAGKEVDDVQANRNVALVADAAAARSAADGLRARIAALSTTDRGCATGDPTASSDRAPVAALGNALGACAARHLELASAADLDRSAGLACEQRYDALTAEPPRKESP